MNSVVSQIANKLTSNFEVSTNNLIHHYAWELKTDQVKQLLDELGTKLAVVSTSSCPHEASDCKKEVQEVFVTHQNYLVVTTKDKMVLFAK